MKLIPILLLLLLAWPSGRADAAIYSVTRCENDGGIANTLLAQVENANATPEHDRIVIRRPCVFKVSETIYIDTPMEIRCVAGPPGCLIIGADITSTSNTINMPILWVRHDGVTISELSIDGGGWVFVPPENCGEPGYPNCPDNNQDGVNVTSPYGPQTDPIVLNGLTVSGFRDEGVSIWSTSGTVLAPVIIEDVLVYGGVRGHTNDSYHGYSILIGGSGSCSQVTIDRALMIGGQARNPLVQPRCPASITNSAAINYGSHGIRATGSGAADPTIVAIDSFHCVPGPNSLRWKGGNYERHCIELVDLQPGSQIYAKNMLGPHGFDNIGDFRPKNQNDASLQYVVTSNPLTFPQPETIPVYDVVPTLLETAGAACRDATTLDVLAEARKVYEGAPNQRGMIETRADMVPHRRGLAPSVDNAGAPPKASWLTTVDPESASGATKWDRWLAERVQGC